MRPMPSFVFLPFVAIFSALDELFLLVFRLETHLRLPSETSTVMFGLLAESQTYEIRLTWEESVLLKKKFSRCFSQQMFARIPSFNCELYREL